MPYIKQYRRGEVIDDLVAKTAGELNFLFTQIAMFYLEENGETYQAYNDIIGALEACKMEIYRRRVAPYEDQKIEENGDV